MAPCSLAYKYHRFRRIYRLYLSTGSYSKDGSRRRNYSTSVHSMKGGWDVQTACAQSTYKPYKKTDDPACPHTQTHTHTHKKTYDKVETKRERRS